jgi:predicted nucleic acid-binding protein
MIECVCDASVVVRWFLGNEQDPLVRGARVLFSELKAGALQVHAPELMIIEVANALWKQVRLVGLAPDDAQRLIADLLAVDMTLHRHTQSAPGALELAIMHGISAYDATYVFLARNRDLALWTLDRKLARAVGNAIDVRVPAPT